MKIRQIISRRILNSSAQWTIETTLALDDGSIGTASIPGGISKGKHEATIIPADESIKKVEKILSEVKNKDFNQKSLDNFLIKLDGTNNKSDLGGNTILSISISFCKAVANHKQISLYKHIQALHQGKYAKPRMPEMMILMLEGGLHGSGSGGATIQEFMAIVDSLDRGVKIYNDIKDELRKLNKSISVGAEGAFSPAGYDNDQVLSLLSGYLHGETIALDAAASSFLDGQQLPNYDELIKNYPITSIEDPYNEEDWTNWELFGRKYNTKITVVTDDLTTTNSKILQKAIETEVGNAIIIKPNQIGTVTETLDTVKLAQNNGWKIVVSHRGSDTNDNFIADLAVGVSADYVKFGAPARGERVEKYNRLLEIL